MRAKRPIRGTASKKRKPANTRKPAKKLKQPKTRKQAKPAKPARALSAEQLAERAHWKEVATEIRELRQSQVYREGIGKFGAALEQIFWHESGKELARLDVKPQSVFYYELLAQRLERGTRLPVRFLRKQLVGHTARRVIAEKHRLRAKELRKLPVKTIRRKLLNQRERFKLIKQGKYPPPDITSIYPGGGTYDVFIFRGLEAENYVKDLLITLNNTEPNLRVHVSIRDQIAGGKRKPVTEIGQKALTDPLTALSWLNSWKTTSYAKLLRSWSHDNFIIEVRIIRPEVPPAKTKRVRKQPVRRKVPNKRSKKRAKKPVKPARKAPKPTKRRSPGKNRGTRRNPGKRSNGAKRR